jgi:hypothetical protein
LTVCVPVDDDAVVPDVVGEPEELLDPDVDDPELPLECLVPEPLVELLRRAVPADGAAAGAATTGAVAAAALARSAADTESSGTAADPFSDSEESTGFVSDFVHAPAANAAMHSRYLVFM